MIPLINHYSRVRENSEVVMKFTQMFTPPKYGPIAFDPHLIQKPEGFASLTWHFKHG